MSYTKAKVNARLIYKGKKSIDDIDTEYQELVRQAYYDIFGVDIL